MLHEICTGVSSIFVNCCKMPRHSLKHVLFDVYVCYGFCMMACWVSNDCWMDLGPIDYDVSYMFGCRWDWQSFNFICFLVFATFHIFVT